MDLQTILQIHKSKEGRKLAGAQVNDYDTKKSKPLVAEIPDLFFDQILVQYKLSRVEIVVLMQLYRLVWCKPNIHKIYGISPMISYSDLSSQINLSLEDLYHALRKLEEYGFIGTIRSGQFFVRRFFTKELDQMYGQTYDDFDC